jgi:hypothetical protein
MRLYLLRFKNREEICGGHCLIGIEEIQEFLDAI